MHNLLYMVSRRRLAESWPFKSTPETIRTSDLLIRNQLLYPLSYGGPRPT